jgi:hypothetical protein
MDVFPRRRLVCGTDRWLITEMDARAVPGALAERCLVSQSDMVVRRLWHYPADWASLSDVALIALFEGRLADVASPRTADRPMTGAETGNRPLFHEARM